MRISNYPTDTLTGDELILATDVNTSTQEYKTVNFSVDTLKTFLVGTDDTNEFTNITLGGSLKFEGATADAYETTLGVVDPTADHTQYLINQGGYIPVLAAVTTTAITSTPAELNLLDTAAANTVVNSKAVIYGSSGELAGTLSTAAQGNVTSLGTLTTLTVDNVIINGTTIGHTSDTDLMTLADDRLTVLGQIYVGVDDTGHDVKFFGATSGRYLLWDESDDALEFADDVRAKFGTGEDLQIYHGTVSGSTQSWIRDVGTNDLILDTNGTQIALISDGDVSTGKMGLFKKDGAVELYHDNSKKVETTADGIKITNGSAGAKTIELRADDNTPGNVTGLISWENTNTQGSDDTQGHILISNSGSADVLGGNMQFATRKQNNANLNYASFDAAGLFTVPSLAIDSTTITATGDELNILDASAGNTAAASNMDTSSGAITSNNYKISHTLTLDGSFADDAELADIVVTNNKVLATSVVVANSSAPCQVDVHTVAVGSFKVRVKNISGGALSDNSTMIINYRVI